MRLLILFMAAGLLHVSAATNAQTVTLKGNRLSFEKVLQVIRQQTGYTILTAEKVINETRPINVDAKNVPIDEFLETILMNLPLEAEIEDRIIFIKRKIKPQKSSVEFHEILPAVQQRVVSGRVTDDSGNPLEGVTIRIKGSQLATTTNANGTYELTLAGMPNDQIVITFSLLGFQQAEVSVSEEKNVNISLTPSISGLEEVVVVGFGAQKRVNLTGAVSTIKSDDIANVPFTQASQVLGGRVSGVTFQQGSGQPGRDQGSIRIRGMGTFSDAGNSPLVLIDGVASSINDVHPSDIANISVLKDASSAAIYGARAANGVIIIETKRGQQGGFDIDYNSYVGVQRAVALPEIMDSWVYAEMENEAAFNSSRSPVWTQEEIALFKSGSDPDNYPNVNHYENLMNSGSGIQTDHNLRFSGGTPNNSYNLSLGYLNQDGLISKTFFERYNLRLNYNSKLSDKFDLGLVVSGQRSNEGEPVSPGGQLQDGATNFIDYAMKIPTTIAGLKSDGTYGNLTGFTVPGWLDSKSFRGINNTRLRGSISLKYQLSESFSLNGLAGYNYNTGKNLTYKSTLRVDEAIFQGPASLRNRINENSLLTLQAYANYHKSFDNHHLTFVGGYSFEHEHIGFMEAFRDNFPNDELYELNAGSLSNMQNSGSATEWALQSLFGRFNYNLNERYLFELNGRYDGSSRFPAHKRYGFFPSASMGWIISNEEFFSTAWIDHLKIRGSWGSLGNQNIGNYPYQQTLSLSVPSYPLGRAGQRLHPATAATISPNTEITWETTTTANIGLEATVFRGALDMEVDFFVKNTKDILYNISTSSMLGLTPAEVNAGAVQNKGWDLRLTHNGNIGELNYNISANASIINNKVTELSGIEQDIGQGLFVGHPLGSIYGYVVDGLFVDDNDIANYPGQPYTARPGDYRFIDLNNDGRVTAEDDRTIIGNTLPKYSYGGLLSAEYRGFDLSLQFRGLAGADRMIMTAHQGRALYLGSNVQRWMYENRWTAENPNPNAEYPRMSVHSDDVNSLTSTYWMRSAAFMRLDNLQLGYRFSDDISSKLRMKNMYIYANVRNLFTVSDYYVGWDPEGGLYPPTRVMLFGVNFKF